MEMALPIMALCEFSDVSCYCWFLSPKGDLETEVQRKEGIKVINKQGLQRKARISRSLLKADIHSLVLVPVCSERMVEAQSEWLILDHEASQQTQKRENSQGKKRRRITMCFTCIVIKKDNSKKISTLDYGQQSLFFF